MWSDAMLVKHLSSDAIEAARAMDPRRLTADTALCDMVAMGELGDSNEGMVRHIPEVLPGK